MSIDKKPVWNYSEFPEDPAVTALMPGFEIQYMIDEDHVEGNNKAVFGHCVFPPISQHSPHRHSEADELVYVIKGRVVNGQIDENGLVTEYECGPGTATFVKQGRIHWSRNPFDEPAEFVFAYYGAASLDKSGLTDFTDQIPINNDPVSGQRTLDLAIDPALLRG
ncbi:hypothetical protein BH10ACT7_BH10ACT7_27410 [soil metagenome]